MRRLVLIAALALTAVACDPFEAAQQVGESGDLFELMVECAEAGLANEALTQEAVDDLRASGSADLSFDELLAMGIAACVQGESEGQWRCGPAPPENVPETCFTSGENVQGTVSINDAIEEARESDS